MREQVRKGCPNIQLFGEESCTESIVSLLDAIGTSTTVRSLRLGAIRWSEDTAAALGRALLSNSSLSSLDIGLYGHRDEIVTPIAVGCASHPKLESIQMNGLPAGSMAPLASAVAVARRLKELKLYNFACETRGVFRLAEAVNGNSRIEKLTLQSSRLNGEMARIFGDGIAGASGLQYLNVVSNRLSSIDLSYIVTGLGTCPNLKELVLDFNAFGPPGIKALAQGMKGHASLRRISLESCGVDGDSLCELLDAFPLISALNLSRNVLFSIGASMLADRLR